jgi:bifunctional DNase/RNase
MRRARLLLAVGLLAVVAGPLARTGAKPAPPHSQPAMVPMEVARVAALQGQAVVVLRSVTERTLLPIWIGDSEAMAIQLRLSRRHAPRPLTHDLLEQVIARLGARLARVHVEDLRHGVFYGRVFLRQGSKELDIDARPSDAIALAVGARAPILVARKVLATAGVAEPPPTRPAKGDKDTL